MPPLFRKHGALVLLMQLLLLRTPGAIEGQVPGESTWNVASEPELVVGDGDEFFQSVVHAMRRPDGSVYVADGGLLNVRAFSRDGRLLWSLGRAGGGPGEFRAIDGIWLTDENGIGVWDGELHRITYLAGDGAVLGLVPVHIPAGADLSGNLEVLIGTLSDGSVLIAALAFGGRYANVRGEPLPDRWQVGTFDRNGVFEAVAMDLRGMRRAPQPLPFSAIPHTATYADTIFSIDDEGSSIAVRDRAGRIRRAVHVDLGAQVVSEPEAALRQVLERRGHEFYLQLLSTMGRAAFSSEVPRIGGLLTDASGLLWVKSFAHPDDSIWLKARVLRPAGGGRWSIHRRDGTRVATISMPSGFTPTHVSRMGVTGVSVDDFGVERVLVYRLDRR